MDRNYRYSEKKPRPPSMMHRLSIRKATAILFIVAIVGWRLLATMGGDSYQGLSSRLSFDTKGREPRVALVSFITSQPSYLYLSLKNKFHYTRLHGYDFIMDYDSNSSRGTTWLKFDMIERLIKGGQYDWIWWLDFDTLFTNMTIPVTDIIQESLANVTNPDDVDFLLTNDCNQLNDGSFIVRSSQRSLDFLNNVQGLWDDKEKEKGGLPNDQEAMRDFIKDNPSKSTHTMFIPQWKINAFPKEIGCYDEHLRKWDPSLLLVHFAGAWAHIHEEDPTGFLMKKYESYIKWGELPPPTD